MEKILQECRDYFYNEWDSHLAIHKEEPNIIKTEYINRTITKFLENPTKCKEAILALLDSPFHKEYTQDLFLAHPIYVQSLVRKIFIRTHFKEIYKEILSYL